MKDGCRDRQRKDSNGRKKSENGHEVKQSGLSKSNVEWQLCNYVVQLLK